MPEIVQSLLLRPTVCIKDTGTHFRMYIMEEIFEIRSCIEILANDIKIYTID